MATKHGVNFRADGPVTAELVENDGNACLRIGSRRQSVEIALTDEQADEAKAAVRGGERVPDYAPVPQATSETAAPKKSTKSKPTKKKTVATKAKKSTKRKSRKKKSADSD